MHIHKFIVLVITLLFIILALPNSINAIGRKCGQGCGRSVGGCDTSLGLKCAWDPRRLGASPSGVCVLASSGCTFAQGITPGNSCCSVQDKPNSVLTSAPGGTSNTTISGTQVSPTYPPQKLTGFAQLTAGPTRTNGPISGTISQNPTQAPNGQPSRIGDCAGSKGGGVLDGVVDLFDVNQFRIELVGQEQTKHCDLDKNGTVDITDFTNYVRDGLLNNTQ